MYARGVWMHACIQYAAAYTRAARLRERGTCVRLPAVLASLLGPLPPPSLFLFDQKPGTVTVLHGILQGFLRLHTSRSLIRVCAKDHLPGLIHVGLDLGNVRGHRAVRS